ncbi:30S ribosomal protein S6 [Synechococcus sp. PCC 7336]|uniref:30S ribosomal protein S6 n=1 Tax=Synechococcus sp. PCC 7336 TaxID=195250 RepID=UPI00034680A3|nr:30S ribosomal protein S6 [Synechococcus sp. PCC 7336]
MPRAYETMIIVRPDVSEEPLTQFIDSQKAQLTEGDTQNIEVQVRGKRRLAYEIQRCREGIYILLSYDAEPSARTAMEKGLRLNESVLRFGTFKVDE